MKKGMLILSFLSIVFMLLPAVGLQAQCTGGHFVPIGGNGDDYGTCIKIYSSGGGYIAGGFSDTIVIDTDTLRKTLVTNLFVASINYTTSSGFWAKSFHCTGEAEVSALAADDDDDPYFVGHFSDTIIIENDTLVSVGATDGFLVKYNKAGTLQWIKQYGWTSEDYITSIAFDPAGYLLFSLGFNDSTYVDGDTIIRKNAQDNVLIKTNKSGVKQNTLVWGGPSLDVVADIAIDAASNIYVLGEFAQTSYIGTYTTVAPGFTDIYCAKINSSLEVQWVKSTRSYKMTRAAQIAVDENGKIIFGGSFFGDLQIGTSTFNSRGRTDFFVAKITTEGVYEWIEQFGGAYTESLTALRVDEDDIFIAGIFSDTLVHDTITLTAVGGLDAFVGQLTSTGDPVWIKSGGGDENELPLGVSMDGNGFVYLIGRMPDDGVYDTNTETVNGGEDVLYWKTCEP